MKVHHPDVARDRGDGEARGKRLNVARHWLADPVRRAQYDRARGLGVGPGTGAAGRRRVAEQRPAGARSAAPARTASGPPFGAIFLIGVMLSMVALAAGAFVGPMAMFGFVFLLLGLGLVVYGAAGLLIGTFAGPKR
jgi:hypothetical protein